MKKTSKALSMILIASILITLLAACGTKNIEEPKTSTAQATTAEPVKEEPLKVNYLALHNSWQGVGLPEPDNFMYKWLLENKNIDIKFDSVADGDNSKIEDRMNMMLASGDVPDVTSVLTGPNFVNIVNQWGEAGYIIPMNEWFDKYPNLLRHSDKKYNELMFASKKDGKTYMIPGNPANNKELMLNPIGPIYKKDWLQQIGKEPPKNTDELYEILKLFKEKIPDVNGKKIIPASFNVYKQWLAYAWTKTWYDASPDYKQLTWLFMNPEIEGYFAYMNRLAREGLLDKETFTQKDDQYQAKLTEGRVGFSITLHPFMDTANRTLREKDPNSVYVPGSIIRVEGKPVPEYLNSSPNMFSGLVISKKFASDTRNLERFMEFLNWNATDEGVSLLQFGPEGMFKVKNEKGLLINKPEVQAEIDKPNNTFMQRTGAGNGWGYYNLLMDEIIPRIADPGYQPETAMAQPLWKEGTVEENLIFSLAGTGPIWAEKWGAMWAEYQKFEAKAVFAKSEEECRKVTQEMLKAYETNGGRDIVNEKLKLLQEYLEKNK